MGLHLKSRTEPREEQGCAVTADGKNHALCVSDNLAPRHQVALQHAVTAEASRSCRNLADKPVTEDV